MKLSIRSFFLLAAASLMLAVCATAQNTTGTISGRITDQSSAVVPGVAVTVSNDGTGLSRTATTNDDGEYVIPFLPIGSYTVRAKKDGFKSQAAPNLRLEILQVRKVDFTLEVGDVSQTVEITSNAPLVETETSNAGQVIKNEQVARLPLNVRQFMQLAFLAPMAAPAAADFRSTEINRDTAVPAGAGQRPEQNNYQIDGVDNKENGRNSFAVSPPVDSVGEFKVQTGMAPAEFGRGGGIIINVVTRGGSNAWHGTAYEFLRNDLLDARPFFANRKNPLKRNQFGGALSGPIRRDKLFFFTNYEGLREASTGNPPVGRVFTDDERNGIFTSAITDPTTGQPFANNRIPTSRISPISAYILTLVPKANNPADPARNFIFNDVPSGRGVRDNVVGRVDYNLSDKDSFYGRYIFNQEKLRTPPSLPAPANSGGRDFILRAQTASAHWNHVFSPTLINNATLGYTRYRNRLGTLNSFVKNLLTPSGITNTLADVDPLFWAAPSVSVPGYLLPSENTPNYRTTNNYQLQDSVIWNRKNHTFKFGGDLKDVREYMFFTGGNGATSFANRYTGNNVADFLLGLPSNVNKTARASEWNSRVQYLGLFAQDDWKVTPKLTLNLGLRYEFETALKQAGNEGLGFDPRTGEVLISQNIRNRARIEDFYRNVRQDIKIRFVPHDRPYDTDFNNFGPRLGFAYALRPDVVLRGGYGVFYSSPEIQSLASSNDFAPITLRPIWNGNPTRPDIGYNPEGTLSAERSLATAPLTIFPFISRDFPYGKVQQWNLNVQKQLGNSFVIETMYQGSIGNQLILFDQINARPPGPGNVQTLLPWPGLARVQNFDTNGNSTFHGASVKLEQRPWHGLSYLVAYTFSKSIDNGSGFIEGRAWTDPNNKREGKAVSGFNIPHRFSAAYEYALPIGRGKAFGKDWSALADGIFGGWGVRGITFLQTGLPQSPSMNLARLGTCSTACTARPDRIADGNLPKDQRTLNRFYDPAAFRLLAAGGADRRVGSAGRNILVAPGFNNTDFQLFKGVKFKDRHAIEFRWEMFNAFNHTNWGAPNVNLESPDFGRITSTAPPRIMQFVLRYDF